MKKRSYMNPNYQEIATHFAVGDQVHPYNGTTEQAGRIVALFPAIGMAEVAFGMGTLRIPVEELQKLNSQSWVTPPATQESVPGGLPVAIVASTQPEVSRVAQAFVKKALYWGAKDRRYRATKEESDNGQYTCPRCKENTLRKAIYKMEEGKRVRLLGCPSCMFLIRENDVVGGDDIEITIKTDGKEVEVKV